MKHFFITIILLFSINSFALSVPPLTGPIVDNANALNNDSALEAQIRALYNNGQGPQINILTISSLDGDNIEQYAHKVFTTWKLGDAKRDDGVLFLVVINDRKMRIEVGQGLEGGLTDLQSKRILGSLKSYFREKDYNGGIQSGLNQIIKTVSQPDAVQQPIAPLQSTTPRSSSISQSSDDSGMFIEIFFGGIILLVVFLVINRIIRGYFRRHKRQMENEQSLLESLQKQEAQALKVAKRYTDKIEDAEKGQHLPLAEAVKKFNKELAEMVSNHTKQEDNLSSLQIKVHDCPMAKMESLKRKKTSLSHDLEVSQRNITQYESLIAKEGK